MTKNWGWKKKELYEFRIRTCYSLHHCCVCHKPITLGQDYHDGGNARRCHVKCAPPKKSVEPRNQKGER
ncbi:MAG: hypothetical protein KAX30_04420 [Candidatus Atribacteria bacterium]|nr:hypothetical protein [Candidatus Atribacteria bacterium]